MVLSVPYTFYSRLKNHSVLLCLLTGFPLLWRVAAAGYSTFMCYYWSLQTVCEAQVGITNNISWLDHKAKTMQEKKKPKNSGGGKQVS